MSRRRAIYPGSFDPVTNGHLDLITRSLGLFDEVIVGVADNEAKSPLFTTEERVDLIRRSVGDQPGLSVEPLNGLLVDFCRRRESFVVIRGAELVPGNRVVCFCHQHLINRERNKRTSLTIATHH